MKIKDNLNRDRNVNITKYLVNWDKKVASNLQFQVKTFLKPYFFTDVVLEEFVIPSSRLRIDLLNISRKIAIEIHGKQHGEFVKHFHEYKNNLRTSWKRDLDKENWIKNIMGYRFIEINYDEVKFLSRKWILEKYSIDII